MKSIDEETLTRIEAEHAQGLTSAEILAVCSRHGVRLSEASLRKYVQQGLLPRSVRVGQKGKHQGSRGVYPVSVLRQILRIKAMMAQSYTIEQIQHEFLFMRSDLYLLEQTLGGIFDKLADVLRERSREGGTRNVARQVSDAKVRSHDLLTLLSSIEARLTSSPRVASIAASST